MKKFILIVLLQVCRGIISDAPYIYQFDRPKIAGHRGLSSLFPENTIESELASMYQGTDFIELDVVVSKDRQLIVSHDVYLSRVTDIQFHSEFADRKKQRTLNGKIKDDWWLMDFTVAELKTLKIKQVLIPGRINVLDGLFTFPTMQEMLDTVISFNAQHKGRLNADHNLAGILIESKDHMFHLQYMNINMGDFVIDFLDNNHMNSYQQSALKAPIVLMSFDQATVWQFYQRSNLPRVQLIGTTFTMTIDSIATYANIVGAHIQLLWDYENQKPSQLAYQITSLKMLMYGWTFQDDYDLCLQLFNSKTNTEMYKKVIRELKIDGIITEFPDVAQAYAQSNKITLEEYQNL